MDLTRIDPATAAGLVARAVGTGTRDGRPTRTVMARRTYDTTIDDLWDAVTNPERLPRWFAPVSGDLRLGGRYQVEGNAGGVIEACDAPNHFAATWEFGGHTSWVRVELTTSPAGTELSLAHTEPVDDPSSWQQFGPGAGGVGWDLALLGLGLHLTSDTPVDPAAAMAWTLSPDGIDFVSAAARSWGDAAIADGDAPAAAGEAVEATIAFYTTEPDDADDPAGP